VGRDGAGGDDDARFIIRMVLLKCLQVFPYIDHLVVGIADKSPLLHHVSTRQSNLKREKNDGSQMRIQEYIYTQRDCYYVPYVIKMLAPD